MRSTRSWLMAGVLGALLAVPAAVRADDPWHRDDGYWGHGGGRYAEQRAYRTGRDEGYRRGLHNGHEDAEHHRRFDYRDDGDYRRADKGYDSDDGPRWAYSNGFREGYAQGYRQAYRQERGWGSRDGGYGYPDRDGGREQGGYYDRDGRWRPYDEYLHEQPRR